MDNAFNQYAFDHPITRQKPDGTATTARVAPYKRGCFILQTKQGAHAVEAASNYSVPENTVQRFGE